MIKNYVIEFEDWESYNAESESEATTRFKAEHPGAEIINIKT